MGHFWMETTEKEWLNKFFSIGNREIDGRPLYKYRLTSAEYENLRQVLAGRCLGPDSLDDLLSDFGFRMLFVFFATEWYKREYSGGTWRWEDIFSRFTRKTVRNVIWVVLGDEKINPKGGKVINITGEQLSRLYQSFIQDRDDRSR